MIALDETTGQLREVRTLTDPTEICACYITTDRNFVITPHLCEKHKREAENERRAFGRIKYERWFPTEQDCIDRSLILRAQWPPEGYGTWYRIVQVCDWWMILAWWADSCD